jgi:hypothetical protein
MRTLSRIVSAVALTVAACSPIEHQSNVVRPASLGKPYVAGIGDTVLDVRQTQSLPNVVGRADVFGRTRDAGRITVRLIGVEGNQAIFVRQDVAIQSNETTMSRTPLILPTSETTTMSGTVGRVPVYGTATTTGTTYIPPTPSTSYPVQAGQVQLVAPIGGSLLVEGRRVNVLRVVDGGIEYSVI